MTDTITGSFLEACGARDALRIVVEHAGVTTQHAFWQPFALVGRDSRADVHLDDHRLSTRHAFLQLLAGRLLFINLQKTNEFERAGWLDPGQTLELGPLSMRLNDDTPVADWVAAGLNRPYPPGTVPPSSLRVFGRGASTLWRMKRPLALVGNSPGCKVRLDDAQISQFHCALVKTPLGLWAVDLLSTNGMTLNGRSVRVASLSNGDELRIGTFTICPQDPSTHSHTYQPATRTTAMLFPPASAVAAPLMQTTARALDMERAGDVIEAAQPANGKIANDALMSSLAMQMTQLQHQFCAQMQQQMADQFQQLMGLFAEAFWGMQREQSALVRRELKRIRRLTSQLSSLQAELGKVPATPPEAAALARPTIGQIGPSGSANSENANTCVQPAAKTATDSGSSSPPNKKPHATFSRRSATRLKSPEEMHSWLQARVNEIQKERNSSWQRILGLIRKKTPAQAPGGG